jgi:hypothetical protein
MRNTTELMARGRGDDHQLQRACRKDAAIVGDDGQSGALPFDGEAAREEHHADDEERHQWDDLDQCGPKLHLAKQFHCDQRDRPLRYRRERAPAAPPFVGCTSSPSARRMKKTNRPHTA